MSDHKHTTTIERTCDVAIIGGSAAGLAAALQLGRLRRSVIVVDAGEPRNAPAAHMHGYLGHEGVAPNELAAIGREEVRRYGVEVLDGRANDVGRIADGRFRVELVGGHTIVSRRVLAATGIVDELPDIDGLAERWGRDVIHCPFCHGYEARDETIVQIVTHPLALHSAVLFRSLSARLTVVLHDIDPSLEGVERLRTAGVDIVTGHVTGLVINERDEIEAVALRDREPLAASVVVVPPRFRARVEAFASLGLAAEPHPTGAGDYLVVDVTGQTGIRGVYAAGNVTDAGHQVLHAAAHGSRVGAMISFDLAEEELAVSGPVSANAADWENRYGDRQIWSGNPNGSLVHEVEGMPPGRALDIGAGEGGDAIWLAKQGWQVTANDISAKALDRADAEARRRGLVITCQVADANDRDVFTADGFDLVSAAYASIPRTADGRSVQNLLKAVAPGGTLLVISHDITPMRAPIDTTVQSRAFDPDAYVRVSDVAAALADIPGWEIEVHETRPRPHGSATHSHHVDDVVFRAKRQSGTV